MAHQSWNQTGNAIDLLPVHYHSHHKKKLGWATGNFELIHYTNMAGKSLMFNRKIASSFVRLYSLSVYVSLPAIGKTGAFPPVLPNRCCHRPTETGNPDGGGCAGNCGMVGGGGGLGKNPGGPLLSIEPWLFHRDPYYVMVG